MTLLGGGHFQKIVRDPFRIRIKQFLNTPVLWRTQDQADMFRFSDSINDLRVLVMRCIRFVDLRECEGDAGVFFAKLGRLIGTFRC